MNADEFRDQVLALFPEAKFVAPWHATHEMITIGLNAEGTAYTQAHGCVRYGRGTSVRAAVDHLRKEMLEVRADLDAALAELP